MNQLDPSALLRAWGLHTVQRFPWVNSSSHLLLPLLLPTQLLLLTFTTFSSFSSSSAFPRANSTILSSTNTIILSTNTNSIQGAGSLLSQVTEKEPARISTHIVEVKTFMLAQVLKYKSSLAKGRLYVLHALFVILSHLI